MNFETTSREMWEQLRRGTDYTGPKRDTGDYEDFYGDLGDEGIDFEKVIQFIRDSRDDGTLIYGQTSGMLQKENTIIRLIW